MGLETGTYLNDLTVTNPVATDPRSEGDDHLRLLKNAVKNTFPALAGRAWRTQSKAAGYTAVANDNMSVLEFTASATLALTAAATLGNGWMALVMTRAGVVVTVDPNGVEQVNVAATAVLQEKSVGLLFCDGTKFFLAGTQYPFSQEIAAALAGVDWNTAVWSIINTYLIAMSNLALGDTLIIADVSAAVGRKVTLTDFFRVFNDFPLEAAISITLDGIPFYDASALEVRKLTVVDLVAAGAATQTQQEAASSLARTVTPGAQQWHPSACKCWGNVDQVGGITASYNVTSVNDDGVGLATITIATDFAASGDYNCVASGRHDTAARIVNSASPAVGTIQLRSYDAAGVLADSTRMHFAMFGALV